jgi:hypothetical protein
VRVGPRIELAAGVEELPSRVRRKRDLLRFGRVRERLPRDDLEVFTLANA